MVFAAQQTQVLTPLTVPGPYRSILHRWKDVVAAYPGRPALSSAGVSYTFAEADALSDEVAIALARALPAGEAPIGAFVGHTASGLIAYLGVLKAGRIVVILDAHLPQERLRDICSLAGITACIADDANLDAARELGDFMQTVVALDPIVTTYDPAAPRQRTAADTAVLAAGLARGGKDATGIVFTSGSTGRPKGVIQNHDELLNDAMTSGVSFRITPEDRVAMVLPYGFAAGAILQFVALLNGAGLWSFDPRSGGIRGLISWIEQMKLTTFNCTPHLLRSLSAALPAGSDRAGMSPLASLRMVSTVGEAVHGRDVAAIRPHLPASATFFNWVGSSEIGTLAVHEIPGSAPVPDGTVPAGTIVANKEVILLREDSSVAGPGEAGEIVAISDYMSGEYWRDDAANALRFSTFTDGRRVCRQGDLGRFDENGDLVLLGRADAAVKVRGYLVEPSEIEAAFLAIEGVTESVVLTETDPPAPTRLVAYVVQEAGLRPHSAAALRRLLRLRLPEYMVPGTIVQLGALPRNERGKVDRRQLPPPPARVPNTGAMDPRQRVVADIWSSVLGLEVEMIGLEDDFMALGGDSLSTEELLVIVRERFGVTLTSTDLLESPTLREFARRVSLGSSALPTHPDVVTLRSDGIRTPLFCFAGAGALALTFLPLSHHFPEHSMYAFQSHGLEKRAIPDQSVESEARRHLGMIRILQPRGPYLLMGHSYGGLVALDVARQLIEAGETVELTALLDTYLPSSSDAMRDAVVGTAENRRRRSGLAWLMHRPIAVPFRSQTLPPLTDWPRHFRSRTAGLVFYPGRRQFDAYFDHSIISSRKYRINAFPGKVLLVFADGNPDGVESWSPLLTETPAAVAIISEHTSLLREPHATELAAAIQAELSRAQQ
ncbi:acyl-CoA synthetase (AMP-forming)/AMP-acid ligase II [Glaciihabitans tibetensis]|uniref:Acyl-CoA synthetase (AMP-forming)/AMP-acid ligase II n=1 Tax=Glaciihabitans tibetensis TaxID=1266600 RepID=A0A2T0VH49_9MICO|nr:AMP-binding protein [Glaciihabitans tibetensis]PRY69403.1 acyl-CoA synthetase (AMP-forming)/AMP-acid ligase II [Glaciihabitans tibetensis]